MRLAAATSAEATGAGLVVVPVGSLEQHGPHLPLDTDTVIATAVAAAVAEELGGALAPALGYGSSGEHQAFAGTVSIGTPVLRTVVVELVRSLRTWAPRVLLVNGHGGNIEALEAAVAQLVQEGHDVAWVPCAVPGMDAHAGRAETSLMLHLRPDAVRTSLAEAGNTAPVGELMRGLRDGGVRAVSRNGVLGDPAGATAAEGARLLGEMVSRATGRASGKRSEGYRRDVSNPPEDIDARSRAELLPEEIAAGSDDPEKQAEVILEESRERTEDPAGTGAESVQTSTPDERPS